MDVELIVTQLGMEVSKIRGGEITCHCPFHTDRHPSFYINQDTGLWLCQSKCGGGNVEQLVKRVLELKTIRDAKAWLKERGQAAGVRVNKVRAGQGKLERSYAKKREPKPCPPFDITAVPTWIIARGFRVKTLAEYQCGTCYFYDALVIPVLQSRALIYRRAPGREPKYKYTEDFKAHNTLYGLHNVRARKGTIILVEGPLDCLWLRQYGYKNSLAIMGGSTVGMEQRRIIKEDLKPKKVILAFDNDEAGQELTDKAVVALRTMECYTIDWEGVEWPDESDDDLTIIPNDVAEVPKDRLVGLLENVTRVTVEEARERIIVRKAANPS